MSEQDLRNESQKYLDEMMRFYSLNKTASINTPTPEPDPELKPESEPTPIPPPQNISDEEIPENIPENTSPSPQPTPTETEPALDTRFPIPEIPDFIREQSPVQEPPHASEPQPEYESYGFLKVEVRTGENGMPVPGAAVTVSSKTDGTEKIIFTGTAGQSGELPKIKLPAPVNGKTSTPESFENYSVYTVSVFANGFYREISADVPVFAGITSIQRFNLIPLPFRYDDKGQSIITRNTEPEI